MTTTVMRVKQLKTLRPRPIRQDIRYDVAIVGARVAGAGTALLLARAGLRVLMVDRTTFPSDTMSGHFMQPAAVSMLRRHGMGEALAALGYPAQGTMTVDFGKSVVSGRPAPMPDGTADGCAPRRFAFDQMLAGAAVEAGADLYEGTSFSEPLLEDGAVIGLRVARSEGTEDIRARLLVGADGKRSRVARAVDAAVYDHHAPMTCAYYTYWEGADVPTARLSVRDGLFAVAVPCGGDNTFLAIQWPHTRFHEIRQDVDGYTRRAIASIPWLAERFADAKPTERYVGSGDLDTFFRAAAGPGWALVGDAGHHKDPITAQGMTDALLDAEVLAARIVEGLGGARSLTKSLSAYAAERDRRSKPMHRVTLDLARLTPPPPEVQTALAAMARDPAAVAQFLGVMAGSVPPAPLAAAIDADAA